MRKLNVIDLDKTYITADSFKKFLLLNLTPKVVFICVLRFLGLCSKLQFARLAHRSLFSALHNYDKINEIALWCQSNTDQLTVSECKKHITGNDHFNVIVSASPDEYVSYVARKMGFDDGFGSKFLPDGSYLHLSGDNKEKFVLEKFSKDEFIYNLAVTDSPDEISLLSQFNFGFLYTEHLFRKIKNIKL
jgi:hypothetical protein